MSLMRENALGRHDIHKEVPHCLHVLYVRAFEASQDYVQ